MGLVLYVLTLPFRIAFEIAEHLLRHSRRRRASQARVRRRADTRPAIPVPSWSDVDRTSDTSLLIATINIAVATQVLSPSMLQRRLGINFKRATELVEACAELGLTGENGQVLVAPSGRAEYLQSLRDRIFLNDE